MCAPLPELDWMRILDTFNCWQGLGTHSLLTASTNSQHAVHNVSLHQNCSTQYTICCCPYSLGTHCTITQTSAADKITEHGVLALGNSRNTSHFPFLSYCFSMSLSLSLAKSQMTSPMFLSFLLYSSERGPSEWISKTTWQGEQRKIEIKSLLSPSFSRGLVHWEITVYNLTVVSKCDLENSDNLLTSNCQLRDFQHLQYVSRECYNGDSLSTPMLQNRKRLNYTFKCIFIL